jgi:mono/diheme cytochrome c family protein
MHKIWLISITFAAFTFAAYLAFRFAPEPVGALNVPPRPKAANAEHERIVLVHDEPELAPGPGRTEFATHCVICHSPRYISMQPRFPRKVWKAEVGKMVDAYKAPIGESDQARIVDYLVAVYGKENGKK